MVKSLIWEVALLVRQMLRIETILDNRMIHPQEVKLNQGSDKDNSWISLSAANPLNNIGYVFPNSMNTLDVQIEERIWSLRR